MAEFTLESMIKFMVDPNSIQQVNNTVRGIKSMIGKALGAIGIGFSLKALNDVVEQMSGVNASLKSALGQFGEMDEIQKKILDTSKDVLGNYEDIAKNVSDLVKNNKTLFNVDNATRFTDIMTKLTKLSGGSNSDAASLVSSIASDLKDGKVSSGTIEALFARAPEAIKILTDYYGVSEQKLRTMAQAGILKAKDLQKAFTDAGEAVDKAFSEAPASISDVITSARSELKYFIAETDEMLGITRELAKILQSGFQFVMKGLQRLRSGIVFLTEKLGGTRNLLKFIAIILASFNINGIINGFKSLLGIFNAVGLKGMFIVGVIALILLAIEDFIGFMQGKKSLLGVLLEKAGLDADEVREKIVNTWKNIKTLFIDGGGWLKRWWEEHGKDIVQKISEISGAVGGFLETVGGNAWETIEKVASSLKKFFKGFKSSPAIDSIKELAKSIGELLLSTVCVAAETIDSVREAIGRFFEKFMTFEMGESFGKFVASFSKLTNSIAKLSKQTIEDVGKAIEILLDNANTDANISAFSHLVEALMDLGSLSLESISKGIDKFTEAISGFFSWIAEGWVNNVDPYIAPVIEDLAKLIEELTDLANIIDEKITPIKEKLEETFGPWFSKLFDDAGGHVEGLAETISSAVKAIVNDLRLIVALLKGDFSKAFELAGEFWGEDFAGIGEGMGKLFGIDKLPKLSLEKAGEGQTKKSGIGGFLQNIVDTAFDVSHMKLEKVDNNNSKLPSSWSEAGSGIKDALMSPFSKMMSLFGAAKVSNGTVGNAVDSHDKTVNLTQNNNVMNEFKADESGIRKYSGAMKEAARDTVGEFARYAEFVR